ncbi:hypothetical protein LRS71_24570 [Rhodococcus pyridinivorans]|uniref:hypothetical protein n=1 Tax=Rhodococcus pyridinivorans TaxID=103816 RepID=UPI001E625EEB|nr:hypothetical protein [Rhodococcus pyridinivorans]MCD5422688.1 hypothetical protein [Rhodococcus pyridinivorans]
MTDIDPADPSLDPNTLALDIDMIDGGLDSALVLLDFTVGRCRDLDPAAVQVIDPATGAASPTDPATEIESIADELDSVSHVLQIAHARMTEVTARARFLYPRA